MPSSSQLAGVKRLFVEVALVSVVRPTTKHAAIKQQSLDPSISFHSLLSQFADATGQRLLINTALNRPGEALVCTPEDAINAFHGTDLNYLILGDLLVSKREEVDDW